MVSFLLIDLGTISPFYPGQTLALRLFNLPKVFTRRRRGYQQSPQRPPRTICGVFWNEGRAPFLPKGEYATGVMKLTRLAPTKKLLCGLKKVAPL